MTDHDWDRVQLIARAAYSADMSVMNEPDYLRGFKTGHASACTGCVSDEQRSGRRSPVSQEAVRQAEQALLTWVERGGMYPGGDR